MSDKESEVDKIEEEMKNKSINEEVSALLHQLDFEQQSLILNYVRMIAKNKAEHDANK